MDGLEGGHGGPGGGAGAAVVGEAGAAGGGDSRGRGGVGGHGSRWLGAHQRAKCVRWRGNRLALLLATGTTSQVGWRRGVGGNRRAAK